MPCNLRASSLGRTALNFALKYGIYLVSWFCVLECLLQLRRSSHSRI
jgi:hypothetical protein